MAYTSLVLDDRVVMASAFPYRSLATVSDDTHFSNNAGVVVVVDVHDAAVGGLPEQDNHTAVVGRKVGLPVVGRNDGLSVGDIVVGDADGGIVVGREVVGDIVVGGIFVGDDVVGRGVVGLSVMMEVGPVVGDADVGGGVGLLVMIKVTGDADGDEEIGREDVGDVDVGDIVVGRGVGLSDTNKFIDGCCCGEDVTGLLVVAITGNFDGEDDGDFAVSCGSLFPGQGKNSQFCSGFLVTIGPLMQKFTSCSHVSNCSLTSSGSFGQGKKSQLRKGSRETTVIPLGQTCTSLSHNCANDNVGNLDGDFVGRALVGLAKMLFAMGDGVVGAPTPLLPNSNDSDSTETITPPKALFPPFNDFKYVCISDVSSNASMTDRICKPDIVAGPLTVMISGMEIDARRRRCCCSSPFLGSVNKEEEDVDRRRFLRLLRLSSSNTTFTNSMEEFPLSKFALIASLTKLRRELSTGLGRLYPCGTLSNIKSTE